MKKIIGIVVVILLIPFFIFVIGDIDRTPIYPTIEFNIIDKPIDKQLLSNDKLLYQLPNTIDITTNELPQYVEYYENGTLKVDSGILNYTINDNLAYINYIEGETTQVVDGEFIVSNPKQIISKSSNLFDVNATPDWLNRVTVSHINNGIKIKSTVEYISNYARYNLTVCPNMQYTFSFSANVIQGSKQVIIRNSFQQVLVVSSNSPVTFTAPNNGLIEILLYVTVNDAVLGEVDYTNIMLNEGTTALPYQPYAEHIYSLGDGVNLYKLPNGVSDLWLQDGTLKQNVGIINTVNNYAEFGTITTSTYNSLKSLIDNGETQVKLYRDNEIDTIKYDIKLIDNKIQLTNKSNELITIYDNDTYTSTHNFIDTINYTIEGYIPTSYTDGKFNNNILPFFWVIPIFLVGGLLYLLIGKRKE